MHFSIKKIKPAIIPLFLLLVASSCYYDSQEFLYPQLNTACDTTSVTYSGSVQSILNTYCLSCHGQTTAASLGGNINLEDYNVLKNEADHGYLLGAVKHEPGRSAMPKGSSMLDDCTIATLEIWINSGSPNN